LLAREAPRVPYDSMFLISSHNHRGPPHDLKEHLEMTTTEQGATHASND
jgi:hypothetical protein